MGDSETDTPSRDDILGSEDHLRAEQIFHALSYNDPGDIYDVAGLGLVLLGNGTWRVFESPSIIQENEANDEAEGYLDTIDPSEFPSASSLYDYLRAHAHAQEQDTEDRSTLEPDTRSPGVH